MFTTFVKCGGDFTDISGEVKFIDTFKYYQKSFAELSATLSHEEKNSVKQQNNF